ncbi:hypothetical protein ACT3R7_02915 [Halomonas sp. AOP43-A1-21]
MLNRSLRKDAVSALQDTHQRYEARAVEVTKAAEILMATRQRCSQQVVGEVETYINGLANSPKEFDRSYAEFKAEYRSFNKLLHELKVEAGKIDIRMGSSAAAGISAGVGTAAFAPTAAIAIATTFGTASTGTAISALSGAAATNAALAWLGGGALAAGGSGMAGGSFLLALAGPVGIAIGVTSLVGSGFFARRNNRKAAEECDNKRKEIEVLDTALKTSLIEIDELINATKKHAEGIEKLLGWLKANAPKDYQSFNTEAKDKLSALVNHIQAMSPLINKTVGR